MMIGKLGSQIGISPDAIPMEEEDASDESITDSATESTTPTSAETEEEEEESDASPRKKKKRSVRMSEKALDNLLKAKIRKFLLSEKEGIVAELQKKVEELSSLKEEWKAKARDLSKQIMDVTVLQQKYEKRKAKTAALKQISTKSIGLQVDVKLTGMMPLHQERQEITPTKVPLPHTSPHTSPSLRPVQQKTTPPSQRMLPKAPATVLTPGPPNHNLVPPKTNLITVSQNKSPMMQQSSQGTVVQQTTPSLNQINTSNQAASISAGALNPTVKNLLDTARSMNASAAANVNIGKQMLPAGYIVVTSIPNAAMIPATTKPLSSIPQTVTAVNTVVAPNQVKFIDLTVEEEGSKGVLNPSRPVQIAGGTGTVVAQPPMVVPSNTMIRHIPPTAQGMPAGGVILAPNLVPTNQQAIQFVFNSSSPAVRPGGLISLTSAANSTSGVRTTSPVTNMASQIRAPMLVRQTAPISSNNITRPIAPPSNSVSRSSITTVPSPTTVNRPPPPLQSAPQANAKSTASAVTTKSQSVHSHPAPLPVVNFTVSPNDKPIPPRPNLKISRVSQGIVLSWNMIFDASKYAEIKSYQLYAYQEGSAPPSTSLWKKVGDVNALPLPMACTLTQFQEGNKYHFAVRPVDKLGRYGQFSDPGTIHLKAFNSKD
ncbi:hypothetical protein FSP39_023792 [Pinctada imbricata]|uniref:Fibronectin type-III domain-containing protein n=1 Tax=Pinctada imbricata TaxID=66713 RepID=A0AA89BQS3_PINIB|nr:hypothetical protein FSP39_023792 [Pinctada imbricata]